MPICIECQHPVKTLWTQYDTGDGSKQPSSSSSAGHNIRLTVCKNCGRFCDKYVEHDFVVLFIDLVLIKPQVYRHLLHNTLMREKDGFDPSIARLGILLLLFDVYLTWARIEKQTLPPSPLSSSSSSPASAPHLSSLDSLSTQPIIAQYLFFLLLCTLTTLAFHLSIRFLTSSPFSPLVLTGLRERYKSPNAVSTALLVSSSTKLFPILMVIWDYDVPAAARSLGWAVVANNVEALKILLDCRYPVACMLAAVGSVARWAVSYVVLWTMGLEGVDKAGEIGDWKALGSAALTGLRWIGLVKE